jgi:transposase-like protein
VTSAYNPYYRYVDTIFLVQPRFVLVEQLFKGRNFDQEIVVVCVRWYLSFKLSYRDRVSMLCERGIIGLAHTTILRWVQHYTLDFEKRCQYYARGAGGSWRMDETYVRVRGAWTYRSPAPSRDSLSTEVLCCGTRSTWSHVKWRRAPSTRVGCGATACVRGI